MAKEKFQWTHSELDLQEYLDDASLLLDEVDRAVHKGIAHPNPKVIQRLCVLIAARYAQAASSLYTIIREKEELDNLEKIQEK